MTKKFLWGVKMQQFFLKKDNKNFRNKLDKKCSPVSIFLMLHNAFSGCSCLEFFLQVTSTRIYWWSVWCSSLGPRTHLNFLSCCSRGHGQHGSHSLGRRALNPQSCSSTLFHHPQGRGRTQPHINFSVVRLVLSGHDHVSGFGDSRSTY